MSADDADRVQALVDRVRSQDGAQSGTHHHLTGSPDRPAARPSQYPSSREEN